MCSCALSVMLSPDCCGIEKGGGYFSRYHLPTVCNLASMSANCQKLVSREVPPLSMLEPAESLYMHVLLYRCACGVYLFACVCVCVGACVLVCVCVCVCTCLHASVRYVFVCVHLYIYMCLCLHMYGCVCLCIHMYVLVLVHTYMCALMHVHVSAYFGNANHLLQAVTYH